MDRNKRDFRSRLENMLDKYGVTLVIYKGTPEYRCMVFQNKHQRYDWSMHHLRGMNLDGYIIAKLKHKLDSSIGFKFHRMGQMLEFLSDSAGGEYIKILCDLIRKEMK